MSKTDKICFIGSTLPISFIVENHLNLNIKKLYVSKKKLEKSSKYINSKIQKKLDIKSLPENKLGQFLSLCSIFLKIKSRGEEVIFFHEISWIIFDIAFYFIKPKYKFFPQVTLNAYSSFDEIDKKEISNNQKSILMFSRLFNFLFKVKLLPKFKLLFVLNDNSNFSEISYSGSFSCQDYKISKVKQKNKLITKNNKKLEGKFVILCGIDVGSKKEQQLITNKVVKLIQNKGIKIDVKGHPNWANIYPDNKFKNINYLDKYLPFEILEDNKYIGIIGFTSTILARYPFRSISLLKLIKTVPKSNLEKKIIHLKSLHKKNECLYPKSEKELSDKIDHLKRLYYG